jgi:ParB family chromosome partitioning protein
MRKKFNMMDLLNDRSKETTELNTSDYKSIKLNPYDVIPSQSNFYSQDNIEELADTFLLVGQQQPTVLGRVNGEFKILSGHRRNLANILNVERGYKKYEEVEYLYKDMSEAVFELSLLIGNAFSRKLTPYEETEQALRLKEALIRARDEEGIEINGKLRDIIAELMNTSSTQIARIESINNNLIEEAKDQFKEGNLGMTAAYEVSRLSEEKQKEIAAIASGGIEVKPKDITTIVRETIKETVSVSDTETKEDNNENLTIIDNNIVNIETGQIIEQRVPGYMAKKVFDRIKDMNIDEMADFICDKCNGGSGCAGICDLAITCTNNNKHETCVKWLNTQT